MDRRRFLKATAGYIALPALPVCLARQPRPRQVGRLPNIVFVMADDMGIGDVGCYNPDSKIPTPNMDKLAGQGIRFTDAHSPSAVCTPTRYGVLTGRYCWRTWLKKNVVGGYTNPLIEPGRTTVGSFLQRQGYRTACIGKWHLGLGWTRRNGYVGNAADGPKYFNGSWQDGDSEKGMDVDFTKPVQGGPADLGFDYAWFTAACSTIDGPFCYIENRRTVGIPDRMIPIEGKRDYRPRRGWTVEGFDLREVDTVFANKAVEFIEKNHKDSPDKPFFVYLALSSPHAPWLPPDFMKGKSKEGPRGDLVAWADWALGRVLDTLDRTGLANDTLVIMTSDNGPRHGANGPGQRGEKQRRGHAVDKILGHRFDCSPTDAGCVQRVGVATDDSPHECPGCVQVVACQRDLHAPAVADHVANGQATGDDQDRNHVAGQRMNLGCAVDHRPANACTDRNGCNGQHRSGRARIAHQPAQRTLQPSDQPAHRPHRVRQPLRIAE